MTTVPFHAAPAKAESPATLADLYVDPRRCRGAVIFHQTGRVLCWAVGDSRVAQGTEEEQGMAALMLPAGSTN